MCCCRKLLPLQAKENGRYCFFYVQIGKVCDKQWLFSRSPKNIYMCHNYRVYWRMWSKRNVQQIYWAHVGLTEITSNLFNVELSHLAKQRSTWWLQSNNSYVLFFCTLSNRANIASTFPSQEPENDAWHPSARVPCSASAPVRFLGRFFGQRSQTGKRCNIFDIYMHGIARFAQHCRSHI